MNIPVEPRLPQVLIVDDDPELASTLQECLEGEGYTVEVALTGAEAMAIQERNPQIVVALVDLMMPLTDGLTLTADLRRRNPEIAVLIMTGYGTIENAVEAMKSGAEDYLTKPFDYEVVRKKVGRLMELFQLRERVNELEMDLEPHPCFENFIHVSSVMQRVVERARSLAASDAAVLLLGETGTGKEMLTKAIHAASPRARNPFIPVNCGALPRDLVESELFGHRRGAFTGAQVDSPGIFSAATGGTVFLDEVGEMPKELQVKLLRVLEQGELRPVGGSRPVQVDVRILSATNRRIEELRGGVLRQDLFYRIAGVTIEIPPLRVRPEDVLVLAQHFAAQLGRRYGREVSLDRSALEALLQYSFPGNVRELQNILEGCIAVSKEDPQVIRDKHLRPVLREEAPASLQSTAPVLAFSMEELERVAISRALRLCKGNRSKAASMLGISRDTLYRKLRQFPGIT